MRARSFSRYSDPELLRRYASLITRDCVTTAALLECTAEVDERKLYLPAGYSSMYAFCVHEYGMSEDIACKRIRAARAAREFPAILDAVRQGRLNLSSVVTLAPYLTLENGEELLAAAEHKTRAEIEELLVKLFPRPGLQTRLEALAPSQSGTLPHLESVPGPVALGSFEPGSAATLVSSAPGRIEVPVSRLTPIAEDCFSLPLTLSRRFRDRLRYAQELLGHEVRPGDFVQVFELAIEALIEKREKRKFGATRKPRPAPSKQGPSANPRYIPRHVKRMVWARDGARCTFVSESGRRCAARTPLEFDHVTEVARGGQASVEGLRLRCRAHNQYGAECTFGAEFMRRKREEAKRAREIRRKESAARAADQARQEIEVRREKEARARAAAEMITPLRLLGFRADEARRAAALCEAIPDASLEERMRHALSHLASRTRTVGPALAPAAAGG